MDDTKESNEDSQSRSDNSLFSAEDDESDYEELDETSNDTNVEKKVNRNFGITINETKEENDDESEEDVVETVDETVDISDEEKDSADSEDSESENEEDEEEEEDEIVEKLDESNKSENDSLKTKVRDFQSQEESINIEKISSESNLPELNIIDNNKSNNGLEIIQDSPPIEEIKKKPFEIMDDSPLISEAKKKPYKIMDDSPLISEAKKKPMIDDPEIIELSDTEPSTPIRKFSSQNNKLITGLLTLSKSAIKGDQRILSSWSPNYADYTPNTKDRIKLERAKSKIKENEPIERKMQFLEIKDEASSSKYFSALDDNPSKLDKNNLRAQVAQGLNRQQTNRNYSYEEKLRALTDPMFENLETKPEPDQNFDDFVSPKGLKVKLLPHQCYSLQWLKWREGEYPHGGILADDMGLGKTLTILAYLRLTKDIYERRIKEKMKEKDEDDEEASDKENDYDDDKKFLKRLKSKKKNVRDELTSKRLKTLIVLPASLLHQWQGEIESKFEKNSFKIHVYHEANRKKYSYNLDDNDIVFTTYEIISREVTVPDKEGVIAKSDSPLVNIKWKRIILDEAHRIKNHSTKANKAMCLLKAKYRIAITGTPIHNSLNDLYSLVKFLHFEPLDDFGLWKYLFASETFSTRSNSKSNSVEREKRVGFWLKFLSDYLILRRTKKDKFPGTEKCIVDLPKKEVVEVRFKLTGGEHTIYQKIFSESKEKVNKFLNDQQNKIIGKASGMGGSNVSEIFVYLLRLRQACCHMSLLAECLDVNELQNEHFEQEGVEGLMEKLDLSDKSEIKPDLDTLKVLKSEALSECLEKSYMSSKIGKSLSMIVNIIEQNPEDKLIVVSQWTSVLSIIARHLKKRDIQYCEIKGDVMLFKRNEIVQTFNDKSNKDLKVMLLSLTAGGVGLNLIGANRMFLLDIHWNPALEQQCADRIYRVGQKKDVTIYKLLCEETIEERIQQIQKYKLEVAEKVCRSGAETNVPGVPGNSKLTIKDFKLLFQDF